VHDSRVTRDVIAADVKEDVYTLLDTGGSDCTAACRRRALCGHRGAGRARDQHGPADPFVVDGKDGVTALDVRIAAVAPKRAAVRLVVNKIDFHPERRDDPISTAWVWRAAVRLGGAREGRTSCARRSVRHWALRRRRSGAGGGSRVALCLLHRPAQRGQILPQQPLDPERPADRQRGTWHHARRRGVPFTFQGRDGRPHPFRSSTPPAESRTKTASSVEYFARLRSLDAIRRTDVVFLVLDALAGVTQQDQAIAGEIVKEAKPVVIVVNKWTWCTTRSGKGRASRGTKANENSARSSNGPFLNAFLHAGCAGGVCVGVVGLRDRPDAERAVKLTASSMPSCRPHGSTRRCSDWPSARRRRPRADVGSAFTTRCRPATGRSGSGCSATRSGA